MDRLDLRDDTIVLFTSDNGPAVTSIHPHGSAGPLRGKKGSLWEGGIRVPGLVQWPGRIRPGTKSDQPVSGLDLLPTLCELAGAKAPTDRMLDGESVADLLRGEAFIRRRPLYWQFNRSREEYKVALRDGDWKLLASLTTDDLKPSGGIEPGEMEAYKTADLARFALFNLAEDQGEERDRAADEPEILDRMRSQMERTYAHVRQEGPQWPDWEFARYEAERIQWPAYRKKKPARRD